MEQLHLCLSEIQEVALDKVNEFLNNGWVYLGQIRFYKQVTDAFIPSHIVYSIGKPK
jgi:hypothetical protein